MRKFFASSRVGNCFPRLCRKQSRVAKSPPTSVRCGPCFLRESHLLTAAERSRCAGGRSGRLELVECSCKDKITRCCHCSVPRGKCSLVFERDALAKKKGSAELVAQALNFIQMLELGCDSARALTETDAGLSVKCGKTRSPGRVIVTNGFMATLLIHILGGNEASPTQRASRVRLLQSAHKESRLFRKISKGTKCRRCTND